MRGANVERAWLNLLNSIEVRRDLVRWRERPRPAAIRLLDGILGKQKRVDQLFDKHNAASFEDLRLILRTLLDGQTEHAIILTKAIDKTRDALVRIEHSERGIRAIRTDLVKIETELAALSHEFARLKSEVKADWRMRVVLGELAQNGWREAPDMLRLWNAFDELYWSNFGDILRRPADDDERQLLVRALNVELVEMVKGLAPVLETMPMLDAIPAMEPGEASEMELVALSPTWTKRPLTAAVLSRTLGQVATDEEIRHVPVALRIVRLGEKLIEEARRSTEDV